MTTLDPKKILSSMESLDISVSVLVPSSDPKTFFAVTAQVQLLKGDQPMAEYPLVDGPQEVIDIFQSTFMRYLT